MAEPLKRTIYTRDDYIDGKIMEQLLDNLVNLHAEYGDRQAAIDDIGQSELQEMEAEVDGVLRGHALDELSKFLDGEKSAISSYENPDGGNMLMAHVLISWSWGGASHQFDLADDLEELVNSPYGPFGDYDIDEIWDEDGSLFITGTHHDGRATLEVRQLTDEGMGTVEEWEDILDGDTYAIGDRILSRIWDSGLAAKPRYAELALGFPAEEREQPECEQGQGRDAVQEELGAAAEKAVADKGGDRGGAIDMGGKMDCSVRDWYMEAFPGDGLGPEISPGLTFDQARESVPGGAKGFYDALGVRDSVVRERVFEELAERMGVDYDEVKRSWLDMAPLEPRGGDTVPGGTSRRIAAALEGYLDASSSDRDLYRLADRLLNDPCFDRAVEAIEGMRDDRGKSAVMQDGRFNVFDPVDLTALVAQISYDTPGADVAAVEDWLDRVNTFSKAAAVEFAETVGRGEPCELYFLPEADRQQGPQVVTLSELREEFEDSPDLEEDRDAGSTFTTWLADGIERYGTVREFTPQFFDGGMSRADIRHDTAREAWMAAFADPIPACGKPIAAGAEKDQQEVREER